MSAAPIIRHRFYSWRLDRRLSSNPHITRQELRDYQWDIGEIPEPIRPWRLIGDIAKLPGLAIAGFTAFGLVSSWFGQDQALEIVLLAMLVFYGLDGLDTVLRRAQSMDDQDQREAATKVGLLNIAIAVVGFAFWLLFQIDLA